MVLYIGPGVGVGTMVIVGIILFIVLLSIGVVIWRPIKRLFSKSEEPKQED